MEDAYKDLEDNRMGICVYLGVVRKSGDSACEQRQEISF